MTIPGKTHLSHVGTHGVICQVHGMLRGESTCPYCAFIEQADPELRRYIEFAIETHRGQVLEGMNGAPDEDYVLHSFRVAMRVSRRAQPAAMIHDCLEDHGVLPSFVDPLTREVVIHVSRDRDRETYAEFIRRCAAAAGLAGEIARELKNADLDENMSRQPTPSLMERYRRAKATLAAAEHVHARRR